MIDHEYFMSIALEEASKAFDEGEVPVGAVVVYRNQILATGYNKVEQLKDSTQHAECVAIRSAAKEINNWRLNGAILYSTLEPCVMCTGAVFQARISKVVWGARDLRTGANGSWVDLYSLKHPLHQVESLGGIKEQESSSLLKRFFKSQRKGVICCE